MWFNKNKVKNEVEEMLEFLREGMVNQINTVVTQTINTMLLKKESAVSLQNKISELSGELATLEASKKAILSKQKIDETEMKHLLRMKEDKDMLGLERREVELKSAYMQKELQLLKEHQEKCVQLMNESKADMQKIYTEIMHRLPNVTMAIRQGGFNDGDHPQQKKH